MGLTVLIGFAEALAAPEAVFSLRAAGHVVRVFTRRGAPAALRGLPVGVPLEVTAPEHNAGAAVEEFSAILTRLEAPLAVMALDDVSLWLVNAALAGGAGADMPIANATGPQAAAALDKEIQISAARAAGLAVPPTAVLREPGAGPGDGVAFPAIVKSARAVQVLDGRLVKGGAAYAMTGSDPVLDDPGHAFPLLVQPLIAGTGEGVFGFATPKGVAAWSGHRRLRMLNPHGSGSSACAVNPPDRAVRAGVEAMIAALGWRGPFMVEFLRDAAGRLWFMELNGRMWGSLALARRNGFEYPAWAVSQALDNDFTPVPLDLPPRPAVRNLGRDLLHLAYVARGPKSGFHAAGWPKFWPAAAAVLKPGRAAGFYNYDPEYPYYFLRDAWETVAARLRGGR